MYNENELQVSDRSDKLDQKENDKLSVYLTQKGLLSQATVVIQLYLSEKPDHKKWTKKHTGVLCFIKDYSRKSFFFHIYNINTLQLLWEQELYKPFKYNKLTSQFHYFDADESIAGLNFGCEKEATKFNDVVLERIMKRDTERKSRKTVKKPKPQNYQDSLYLTPVDESKPNPTLSSIPLTLNINSNNVKQVESSNEAKVSKKKPGFFDNIFGKVKLNNKTDEKKPIKKLEISAPTHFEHIQHVGTDGKMMILADDIVTLEMKKILQEAKIKITDKNLEMMKEFIVINYDVEEFAKEIYETIENEEPISKPQQLPKKKQFQTYESNDLMKFEELPAKPPPPVPSVPPPLPPNPLKQQSKLPPPSPPVPVITKNPIQSTNASGGPPPPPPPPPLPAQLFQATDKPVIKPASSAPKSITPVSDNSALLNSISAFKKEGLKPVDVSQKPEKPVEKSMRNDLLQKITGMRAFIQESDDEDEDEDTDDEDWQN